MILTKNGKSLIKEMAAQKLLVKNQIGQVHSKFLIQNKKQNLLKWIKERFQAEIQRRKKVQPTFMGTVFSTLKIWHRILSWSRANLKMKVFL